MRPEKCSSIAKSVEPSSRGSSAKVRTPLKTKGRPSLHIMCRAGTTPVTLGVNVRFVPGTCSLSRSPSRIWPSMLLTVEFQRGNPLASVKRLHTGLGVRPDVDLHAARHRKGAVRPRESGFAHVCSRGLLTACEHTPKRESAVSQERVLPVPQCPAHADVRIATISPIATLPEACINHDPRIEPDLIRTQPKQVRRTNTKGKMSHSSGAKYRIAKCGRKTMNACARLAQP